MRVFEPRLGIYNVLLVKNILALFSGVMLAVLACGCAENVALLDGRDRSNAMMRNAALRKSSGNIDGALQAYSEVLDRSPKLAVAHLEMALIFHDNRKDYLRAIYHYQRYLELRPGAEKKKIIEDRIRLAGQLYVAKIAADGSVVSQLGKFSDAVDELKKENDALKSTVRQLNMQLDQAKSKQVESVPLRTKLSVAIQDDVPVGIAEVSSRNGKAKLPASKVPSIPRAYVVKRGDSLRSIAAEMYRDVERAEDIFKANSNILESPGQLKIGQTLVLP